MSPSEKWRIGYLKGDGSDHDLKHQVVAEFNRIYTAENEPKNMAMFTHNGGGFPMALSITPEAYYYCKASPTFANWEEWDNPNAPTPLRFGEVGWEAGDVTLKNLV